MYTPQQTVRAKLSNTGLITYVVYIHGLYPQREFHFTWSWTNIQEVYTCVVFKPK